MLGWLVAAVLGFGLLRLFVINLKQKGELKDMTRAFTDLRDQKEELPQDHGYYDMEALEQLEGRLGEECRPYIEHV